MKKPWAALKNHDNMIMISSQHIPTNFAFLNFLGSSLASRQILAEPPPVETCWNITISSVHFPSCAAALVNRLCGHMGINGSTQTARCWVRAGSAMQQLWTESHNIQLYIRQYRYCNLSSNIIKRNSKSPLQHAMTCKDCCGCILLLSMSWLLWLN